MSRNLCVIHDFGSFLFFSRKIVFENFYYGLKEMFLALVKRPKCISGKIFLVYVNGSLRK